MLRVLVVMVVAGAGGMLLAHAKPSKGPHFDSSIKDFDNERTCWTGEVCKMEFQSEFRCRCPQWSWCRSPGRYYHAYCSMSALGYIWVQQGGPLPEDAINDM